MGSPLKVVSGSIRVPFEGSIRFYNGVPLKGSIRFYNRVPLNGTGNRKETLERILSKP